MTSVKLVGLFKEDNWSGKRGSKTQSFHTSERTLGCDTMWSVYTELGGRSVRNVGTFTQNYTSEQNNRLKYNQDIRYQVLIMGDQVRSQCRPFQLVVIKRKYDRLFSEHNSFHPSVVLPPTLRIHIHLSNILHSICTVHVLTVSFHKLKKN